MKKIRDNAFHAAVVEAALADLSHEEDPVVALRKAVLVLLFLHDENAPPSIEALRRYLLLEFPPLADAFRDHKHPLLGDEVLRARVGDNVRLLIREKFGRFMAAPETTPT